MYATLHSATTAFFLFFKLRTFILSRNYHRGLAQRTPRGGENEGKYPQKEPESNCLTMFKMEGERELTIERDESMGQLAKEKQTSGTQTVKQMISCSVKNLLADLRDHNSLQALLRFLLTQVLPTLLLNVMRSSLFLGLYCASGWLGACIAQRTFLMKDVRWFYPWLALPGLASLLEVPSRRRELALYCSAKALENGYAVLKKYSMIPKALQWFKNGEVFLFSVGSAITLFCYANEKQTIKPALLHIMEWLWGL